MGLEDKIVNMTNGVTPRRWVHCANPALSAIFTKYLGSHERPGGRHSRFAADFMTFESPSRCGRSKFSARWLTDMTKLKVRSRSRPQKPSKTQEMLKYKEDPKLHSEWMEMSGRSTRRLSELQLEMLPRITERI